METKDIKDISDSKLVTSIYSDVASPAMKQIGQSAEGLLKFVALPFKFLGLTAEQLEKKYTKFIEEAVNRVPPEKLTEPKSSVVAPLLDYVKFCFADEPGNGLLQEMFSNLLSSSINQDNKNHINKSLVETMRFLSGNEATLLQWCSDTIITRRAYDEDLTSSKPFPPGWAILSKFTLYHEEISREGAEWSLKSTEICANTPHLHIHFDFPIAESLDLLTSLGLIKFTSESYCGMDLFKELLRLNDKGLLGFGIPPLFASVMLYAEADRDHSGAIRTEYPDYIHLPLLKSEITQLCNSLPQNQNIPMEDLITMSCSRSQIFITQYGYKFLNCCIKSH